MEINKTLNPYSVKGIGNVFIKIKYQDGKLSISGVESPRSTGNCRGSCGQIVMHMPATLKTETITYKKGWSRKSVLRLIDLWEAWHLNDMRAGTPKQEKSIKDWLTNSGDTVRYTYESACEYLKTIGIYNDNGYIYGTKWLKEEVPVSVLQELADLPETKITPAWV